MIKWYDKWMEFDFFPSIELSKSHSLWNVCMPWFKEPLQMLTVIFVNCTAQPICIWSISKKNLQPMINDSIAYVTTKKYWRFLSNFYFEWERHEKHETLPGWPETSPLFPLTKFEQFFNDLIRRGSMCRNSCSFLLLFAEYESWFIEGKNDRDEDSRM